MVLVGATLIGCGNSSAGTDTQGGGSSGDSGDSTTMATNATTSTGGVSETQTPTTGHESHSGSDTSATATVSGTDPTTDSATEAVSATDTGTTAGTGPGMTTGGDTSTGGGDTSTSGDTTSTSSETTNAESSTTEPGCIPSAEVCNDIDDDCDGEIDDVDVGGDGICDCLSIALVGNQGANPSAEFQAWLIAQGTKVDRIHQNPAEVLDKATVAKYDIMILDYLVRSYTAEEAAVMKTWVEAGGGLMAMTGFTNTQVNADRPNSLIKPMGLSYNTSKGWFSGPVTNFLPHPITETLTSISFFGGLYIDTVEDGTGINMTIMTLPQGPVGAVQERKNGRLFAFGDEWIEFDSEWKNIPQIKKFWVQTLAWLGPQNSCSVPQ